MKKLEIHISKNGIKVYGDGAEIITPNAVSIVMEDKNQEPQPAPAPDDEFIYFDDFKEFDPEVTHTRLTEPVKDWAVLNCVAENSKSINLPQNVQTNGDILCLSVKPQTAKYGKEEKPYTTGLAYSKQLFGKGRLDVRANLCMDKAVKNSIWATTSTMTDEKTGLKYLYEFDIVEYTPAHTGERNTSRGMWCWQENQQSVSADKLPYNFPKESYSFCGGNWYWTGKAWMQSKPYPIYKNGNRLKGTNGRYYYITNTQRGVDVSSSDLEWIREDGKTGKGLDNNKYFVVTNAEPIGGGAVTDQFLNGKITIGGWHIWSVVVDDDSISFLCDNEVYWSINNKDLQGLTIQDDITLNVIFAASVVGDVAKTYEMQVDYVRFIPKEED